MENNKQPNLLPIDDLFDDNQTGNIIKVIGVGGGGGNALTHMFNQGIKNVDFVIANTDIQVLKKSVIPIKIQLGKTLTEGLGAGNDPERGKNAAIESKQDIIEVLKKNTKMLFIAAGMGGGTGTGAAPVIAEIAKELGILTVAIVTLPFRYEGNQRLEQARTGLLELKKHVDAIIVIDNEKINDIYGNLGFNEAFHKADDIIATATKGIAEIITKPGLVNVDFADVKSVLQNSGVALMGTGIANGKDRAEQAVKLAINSPLLNNNDIRGAKNILVNISSPAEKVLTNNELKLINDYLQNKAGNNANLIWGSAIEENLQDDYVSVTVVATGFNANILNSFELIKNNNIPEQINTNQENEIQQNNPTLSIKSIIQQLDKRDFNFLDDETINNYENRPAFERHNIKLNTFVTTKNNNSPKSTNKFINPMLD